MNAQKRLNPLTEGGEYITPKQEKAIAALLTNPTKQEAAEAAGISPATLRRYLADEDFQREYRQALSGLVDEAATQARQSLAPALRCLRGIVSDEEEAASTKIQASRALLEYGLQIISVADIESKLQELERLQELS